MLMQLEKPASRRRELTFLVSLGLHCLALIALLHRAQPIFVAPSSVQRGNGLHSYGVVYLAQSNADRIPSKPAPVVPDRARPTSHSLAAPVQPRAQQPSPVPSGDSADPSARAGNPFGSLATGPAAGQDVRPAYPTVFPDPPVSRWDFPSGFQGDVIVEVTIDRFGNVVETRLLQGLRTDVDQKVIATVQHWRYHPAMVDGQPVASRHDVHFHYPA